MNIGFHSEIFSGSTVTVGRYGLFAAYTYLVGGGHAFDEAGVPGHRAGSATSRGIRLGDNVWLGAGAKVMDGVRIGDDVVVGAGAVVTGDLPDGAVAVGRARARGAHARGRRRRAHDRDRGASWS